MESPVSWIFETVFGCHHGQLSRVFTIKKRTYRVCFECGREFDYSWERMHFRRPLVSDRAYPAPDIATQAEAA